MDQAPLVPNAGVWASIKNGLIRAGITGIVFGLLGGLLGLLSGGIISMLFCGVFGGLLGIVFGGLLGGVEGGRVGGVGAALNHYVLRLLLWYAGAMPLRYVYFLEFCRQLLFFSRTGGVYQFWHLTLRDYLANLTDEQIAEIAQAVEQRS